MKLGKQFRALASSDMVIDAEKKTIEFSFSSTTAVERFFGNEILSHREGAMDLQRVKAGATPLLWNHDTDKPIGVIQSAEVRGDKGYAKAKFLSNPLATEKFQDVVDGLRNISFGYQANEVRTIKPAANGEPADFEVTQYEVFEMSLVSIPADPTIGVGRASADEGIEVRVIDQNQGEKVMEPKIETPTVDAAKIRNDAALEERARTAGINTLGEKFKKQDLARQLIEGGKSLEVAREAFLEAIQERAVPVTKVGGADLGLTEDEKKNYSIVRALRAQILGDWKEAGFERSVSDAIAKEMGKQTTGFFMPTDIKMDGKRSAYAAGSATTGGNIVATNLLADAFIDLLRNKMLVMQMGAKVLSGLVGNIAIPKQTASSTAYWVTEAATVTESEGTFGQVLMNPKTVGARSQVSRQLLMQGTPDIEMLIRNDLAAVIALAIDAAAINGSGSSGQPLGILNQSGIGSVAMGTNGAALTNIDPLVDLETAVATANADFGSLGYMTNPVQVGKMKKLKTTTNEYLWNGFEQALMAGVPGEINGYRVGRTNQSPSNLTKGTSTGVCSALLFGNWSDLLIGQWGPGIEILANPYGAGFNAGSVDLRALASVDVAVRNAVSFAAITDLL